jgi:hypothetical protein
MKKTPACKSCRDEFGFKTMEETLEEHWIFSLNHIEMRMGRKLDALQREVFYDKIEADFKKNLID